MRLVSGLLMRTLQIYGRVSVKSKALVLGIEFYFDSLLCFGLTESVIHHVLIVVHKLHFALES